MNLADEYFAGLLSLKQDREIFARWVHFPVEHEGWARTRLLLSGLEEMFQGWGLRLTVYRHCYFSDEWIREKVRCLKYWT